MTLTKKRVTKECYEDKEAFYYAESKGMAMIKASKDVTRWTKLELDKLKLIANTMYNEEGPQIGMGVRFIKGKTCDRYQFDGTTLCYRVSTIMTGKYVVARLA